MPPILVLLGAAAVGLAVPVLWWALAAGRGGSHLATGNLHRGGIADARDLVLTRSAGERAVQPAVRWLATRARRLTPAGWVSKLERRITLAGRPAAWPLERVLAAKLLLGVAGLIAGYFLLSDPLSILRILSWVGLTAGGYFAPDIALLNVSQKRQPAIQDALPDTLDQMMISVEAGIGFESAMARAGRTGHGPLAEELVRTLQEIQLGVSRSEAMRNLADRTDVADVRHFVLAVVQAEKYGIPIADVLRNQANELRIKRRQRAEERAMKIPVKIVFPLVLCILPALFIVVIGPGAIRIMRAFGGG